MSRSPRARRHPPSRWSPRTSRNSARGPGEPGGAEAPDESPDGGKHMTETTASGAAQGSTGARKGLTIRRIHTREGVHPYDEVTWERRDVVMTNWRDGSVNFEQDGVEFPEFWSVNAANIVTTKYFRGALGTVQREWSLKQLVDRVVGAYGAAGREHGYFGTEQDAASFEHKLKHALSHQGFNSNSPAWFTLGTSSPRPGSACPT